MNLMLAPRGARWVEEEGRFGESAALSWNAFSPNLPPSSTLRRPAAGVPACGVFFVSSSRLRAFVLNLRVLSDERRSPHASPYRVRPLPIRVINRSYP